MSFFQFSMYFKCQSILFTCFSQLHTQTEQDSQFFHSLLCLFCRKTVLITRAFVLYFFRARFSLAKKHYTNDGEVDVDDNDDDDDADEKTRIAHTYL